MTRLFGLTRAALVVLALGDASGRSNDDGEAAADLRAGNRQHMEEPA